MTRLVPWSPPPLTPPSALPLASLLLLLLLLLLPAPTAAARELVVGHDAPTLQATLTAARAGDVVVLPRGVWAGPVSVTKTLTLRGLDGAVIDGGGHGTVLRIDAPDVVVEALAVRRSGADLSGPDACIRLEPTASRSVVHRCTVSECAFGIWVHKTHGAELLDNRVHGAATGHRSNRGNGIQLFDASDLLVIGNHISDGRDGIYVSATETTLIAGNHITRARYGVHYMFSYDTHLRGNIAEHNSSGYALMGSHRITVEDNVARGNDDHGVLLRDVQGSTIRGNVLEGNGEGLFMYSCTENLVTHNRVANNAVGAKIWAGSLRNRVNTNVFVGNHRQIFYVASADLVWGVDGPGNFWGDYLGWDQDGDGVGDRPYKVDSFGAHLMFKYPAAAVLMRSPALELLAHLEARMPILAVPTVIDRQPLMKRTTKVAP